MTKLSEYFEMSLGQFFDSLDMKSHGIAMHGCNSLVMNVTYISEKAFAEIQRLFKVHSIKKSGRYVELILIQKKSVMAKRKEWEAQKNVGEGE